MARVFSSCKPQLPRRSRRGGFSCSILVCDVALAGEFGSPGGRHGQRNCRGPEQSGDTGGASQSGPRGKRADNLYRRTWPLHVHRRGSRQIQAWGSGAQFPASRAGDWDRRTIFGVAEAQVEDQRASDASDGERRLTRRFGRCREQRGLGEIRRRLVSPAACAGQGRFASDHEVCLPCRAGH